MVNRVVILGGGVGGLAAGWMLARTGRFHVVVCEREAEVGGMCRTLTRGDFAYDLGPHKCYSVIPGILDELTALMGEELLTHRKRNRIYLFDRFLRYPVRFAELARHMGAANILRCAADVGPVLWKQLTNGRHADASYADYVRRRFGPHLYRLVFEPLAEKTWGSPETLSAAIAQTRIPSQGIGELIAKVLRVRRETAASDAESFYYPARGFGRIPERMREEIERHGGRVSTRTQPTAIRVTGRRMTAVEVVSGGETRTLDADIVVSTLPFDTVLGLVQDPDGARERAAMLALARRLEYRGVILAYLVASAERLTEDHWLFFPGRDVIFGRCFEQRNMSEQMVPRGKTVVCCDLTAAEGDARWRMTDAEMLARCRADLERVGLLRGAPVLEGFVLRAPKFYPRYGLEYRETTGALYAACKRYENFCATGRIGLYNYNNSDHCVDMGKFLAEELCADTAMPAIWDRLEERVAAYRIVD
ncbi:MAG: FAD-dependent oxidoreductase [Deltaproteobacteria bacterium]|nr:FAD-dependent oxidoreductase [Deltaproteobacteria bacterium]